MVKIFRKSKSLSQTQYIASGFFLIIMIGTIILMMPFSARNGQMTDPLTALFTATSATCVTGLVVVDTYQHWSLIGQLVILCMIQLGGLGFMTIGVFFSIFLRRNIGLRERGRLQESVNTLQIGGIVRLAKKILKGTLFLECAGSILLAIRFVPRMGVIEGIYNGIFHSISAFCNAGFDLMGKYEAYSSFVSYQDDILVNAVLMTLVVVGGIGFVVWDDVTRNGFKFKRYALHTKFVLLSTTILIFGGAILFYLFERNGILSGASPVGQILMSLFASVSPRTAGFNTVDLGAISTSSQLLTIFLMFIGGSPGSTAGGIKTTTIVVMLLYVIAYLQRSSSCEAFDRRLDDDAIKKASTVFTINLSLAVISAMLICAFQTLSMNDVLFEVFSAIGTVGMTTGITRDLGTAGRIVIMILMYCGRIGSLTFAFSFIRKKNTASVRNPMEKITVG